jgi:hypothetical protein
VTPISFDPCGHTLLVDWVPTVSYYENRLKPIQELEDAGTLLQFRLDADSLGARLASAEIEVGPSRLALLTGRTITDDVSFSLLNSFLESVKPRRYTASGMLLQFVVPLEGASYDDARAEGLTGLGNADLASVGAKDFSVVLDGGGWNLEAGIIAQNEIEMRMTRSVGGFSGIVGSTIAAQAAGSPAVAFFCDSYWPITEYPPLSGAARWFLDKVPEVVNEAQVVVKKVFEGITNRSSVASERLKR